MSESSHDSPDTRKTYLAGIRELRRVVRRYLVVGGIALVAYVMLVVLLRPVLRHLAFGGQGIPAGLNVAISWAGILGLCAFVAVPILLARKLGRLDRQCGHCGKSLYYGTNWRLVMRTAACPHCHQRLWAVRTSRGDAAAVH